MACCLATNCDRPSRTKGFCSKHYIQWRRATDLVYRAKELAYLKKWKAENKEKHAEQQRRKHLRHKDKDNAYRAAWKRAHKKQVNANTRARKTRLRRSSIDRTAMQKFYLNCPENLIVDHIIPLNHSSVCGLHCLANLQYLTEEENYFKSNKFDGTYTNDNWRKDYQMIKIA